MSDIFYTVFQYALGIMAALLAAPFIIVIAMVLFIALVAALVFMVIAIMEWRENRAYRQHKLL
jgi:uncharacterized Tic20 family protein